MSPLFVNVYTHNVIATVLLISERLPSTINKVHAVKITSNLLCHGMTSVVQEVLNPSISIGDNKTFKKQIIGWMVEYVKWLNDS